MNNDEKAKVTMLYENQCIALKNLLNINKDSFCEVIVAIMDYQMYGVVPTFNNEIEEMIWSTLKPSFDSAARRRKACIENGRKGTEYGKLGGRPKKGETKEEAYERRNGKTGDFGQENDKDEQVIEETPKVAEIEQKAPLNATEDTTPISEANETPENDEKAMVKSKEELNEIAKYIYFNKCQNYIDQPVMLQSIILQERNNWDLTSEEWYYITDLLNRKIAKVIEERDANVAKTVGTPVQVVQKSNKTLEEAIPNSMFLVKGKKYEDIMKLSTIKSMIASGTVTETQIREYTERNATEIDGKTMFTNPSLEFKDEPDEECGNLNMEKEKQPIFKPLTIKERYKNMVNDIVTIEKLKPIVSNNQGKIMSMTLEDIQKDENLRSVLAYNDLKMDDLLIYLINEPNYNY